MNQNRNSENILIDNKKMCLTNTVKNHDQSLTSWKSVFHLKYFVAILTVIITSLNPLFQVQATEGDPDDLFYVVTPSANQKIKGTYQVEWRMYDDDQSPNISFTTQVLDSATCRDQTYGAITTQTVGTSSATNNNTISWNTRSTVSQGLSDGKYCLKICASLKNGATPYSACNSRYITIINYNKQPSITTSPKNLTIKESDSWKYNVNASDPDGDTLNYWLVTAPNFLKINKNSGLIQTNSVPKNLPKGIVKAEYDIRVAVSDGLTNPVYQNFTLVIVPDNPPEPAPTPVPTPKPKPVDDDDDNQPVDEPDVNQPTQIGITYPKEGDSLFGEDNQISLKVEDPEGIDEISLYYSSDKENWNLIKTFPQKILGYKWNVSEIDDGSYFLKVSVKDSAGITTSKISDEFEIDNDKEQGSEPLIVNIEPQNGAEITETKPNISGEFVPSLGKKIDTTTFEISLNGESILKNCQLDDTGFLCTVENSLEEGKQKVIAQIKDTSNKQATQEWEFSIVDEGSIPVDDISGDDTIVILGQRISRQALVLVAIICIISGILLLVPWILYILWQRKKNGVQTTTETTYDYTDASSYTYPTPSVTTNYYTPDTTTNYDYNIPPSEPTAASFDSNQSYSQPTGTVKETTETTTTEETSEEDTPDQNNQPGQNNTQYVEPEPAS